MLAYCVWEPQFVGWFLRRTFCAFLNGLNGEATNSDDVSQGSFMRRMNRNGVPIEELDVDIRDFEPRPAGALPTRSANAVPEPLFGDSEENGVDPAPMVDEPEGSIADPPVAPPRIVKVVDVFFVLPVNETFVRLVVCYILGVFLTVWCEYFCWFCECVWLVDLSDATRIECDIVVSYLMCVFNTQLSNTLHRVALERGMGCTPTMQFRPVLPYICGYTDGKYELAMLDEYNACYAAQIDFELAQHLVARFVSHKDVASTLNTMFEGAKKYPGIELVQADLVYNTVLYAYQVKKLQTRTASAARGRCDAQLVQLN